MTNEYTPFPEVDPGTIPLGSMLLVQIRSPRLRTSGGIILTAETQETNMWNEQVAKVLAIGPLCFKNRTTGAPWPEGQWCDVGDLIRVPKYGGDRYSIHYGPKEGEVANFVVFKDTDVIAKVRPDFDASKIRAYV